MSTRKRLSSTLFTKQRDKLLERREELDKSAESIEELVQVLDLRKDGDNRMNVQTGCKQL